MKTVVVIAQRRSDVGLKTSHDDKTTFVLYAMKSLTCVQPKATWNVVSGLSKLNIILDTEIPKSTYVQMKFSAFDVAGKLFDLIFLPVTVTHMSDGRRSESSTDLEEIFYLVSR